MSLAAEEARKRANIDSLAQQLMDAAEDFCRFRLRTFTGVDEEAASSLYDHYTHPRTWKEEAIGAIRRACALRDRGQRRIEQRKWRRMVKKIHAGDWKHFVERVSWELDENGEPTGRNIDQETGEAYWMGEGKL